MYSYHSLESHDNEGEIITKPSLQVDNHPDPTVFSPNGDLINDNKLDSDDGVLVALGYRQEFKREFTVWSIFCLSFSSLGLLPSIAATLYYTLGFESLLEFTDVRYAGMGGMVWGWIIASFMTQFLAASIAELCSSLPTTVCSPRIAGLIKGGFVLRLCRTGSRWVGPPRCCISS
jgi:hypothetical protein